MKKTIFFIVVILLVCPNLSAQTKRQTDDYSYGFHFGVNAFIPQKDYVRNEFTLPSKFGYLFGGSWFFSSDLELNANVVFRALTLERNNIHDFDLAHYILPVEFKLRQTLLTDKAFTFYGGIGVELIYFAEFAKFKRIYDNGQIGGIYSEIDHDFGFGTVIESGFRFIIRRNHALDCSLKYDYTFIGDVKTGSPGNIGGLSLNVCYNYLAD